MQHPFRWATKQLGKSDFEIVSRKRKNFYENIEEENQNDEGQKAADSHQIWDREVQVIAFRISGRLGSTEMAFPLKSYKAMKNESEETAVANRLK